MPNLPASTLSAHTTTSKSPNFSACAASGRSRRAHCEAPHSLTSLAKWQGTARRDISPSKKVSHQHGNGIDDSPPSGSGNLDVVLGRQWLPLAHPLQPLK